MYAIPMMNDRNSMGWQNASRSERDVPSINHGNISWNVVDHWTHIVHQPCTDSSHLCKSNRPVPNAQPYECCSKGTLVSYQICALTVAFIVSTRCSARLWDNRVWEGVCQVAYIFMVGLHGALVRVTYNACSNIMITVLESASQMKWFEFLRDKQLFRGTYRWIWVRIQHA